MPVIVRYVAAVAATLAFASWVSAQAPCSGASIFAPAACAGDEVSADERDLFNAVNAFRTANGKPALRLSVTLSIVGNRRMLDLTQNVKSLSHSWSNCPYDIGNEKTWTCMMDSPARLKSGYNGTGYETLYATGSKKVDPSAAVTAWSKSQLHSSIILGTGSFSSMHWDEFGVAISGGYATLWFGAPADKEAAVSVATRPIDIVRQLGAVEEGPSSIAVWRGKASNAKLRVEIDDRAGTLTTTQIRFFAAANAAETIGEREREFVSRFVRSIFPDWRDSEEWLAAAIRGAVVGRRSVKRISGAAIEVSPAAAGEIRIAIYPDTRTQAKESY
jgi:uncharacterized protein YkwD